MSTHTTEGTLSYYSLSSHLHRRSQVELMTKHSLVTCSPCWLCTRMLRYQPLYFSTRRGARVDESTCLESMRPGNGTVGSNPTLSAILYFVCAARSLSLSRHSCGRTSTSRCCAVLGESHLRKGAGPCAIEPCEPRQVRKEATVSGQFYVPQDHLAPLESRYRRSS